jgi:hypothetical protein
LTAYAGYLEDEKRQKAEEDWIRRRGDREGERFKNLLRKLPSRQHSPA